MANAESELDLQAEYVVYLQAQYEEISKHLEAEEQLLNYLMKVKQGEEETLDFLIEKSRKNAREMASKIQEIIQLATPLTAKDLDKLGVMKKQMSADQQVNPERESKVKNDGCPTPSRKQTCSGEQNTNDVPAFGDEAISTPVLSTGAPPGCGGPRPKCLGVGGVMPSGQVFTDSRHHSPTSLTEESNNKVVVWKLQSASVPGRNETNVDIKDSKVTKTKENKLGNIDMKKKNEKKKNKKKEKNKMKAEKVKSTKVRRGFLSCFLCCFRSQEKHNVMKENVMKENVMKETTV